MAENTSQKLTGLRAYLAQMGVTDATPQEQVNLLKKQYRKVYQQQYDQERRRKTKRLEPTLSKEEYNRLKKEAKRHKKTSLSGFLKECAFAYLEHNYIAHDADLIREYTIQVKRIGNNVNQLAHAAHYQKDYSSKAIYQQMKAQVDALQGAIEEHLNTSLPIGKELARLFTEQPETMAFFEEFLTEFKAKHP